MPLYNTFLHLSSLNFKRKKILWVSHLRSRSYEENMKLSEFHFNHFSSLYLFFFFRNETLRQKSKSQQYKILPNFSPKIN
jgi:hypothetical protein